MAINPRKEAAAALERALRTSIAGEVRFDRVSRALYSTDASVYRIEPAGVVVPRTREDVVRTVEIAGAEHVATAFFDYRTEEAFSYRGDEWFHAAILLAPARPGRLYGASQSGWDCDAL